jgi:hypothetical protein
MVLKHSHPEDLIQYFINKAKADNGKLSAFYCQSFHLNPAVAFVISY